MRHRTAPRGGRQIATSVCSGCKARWAWIPARIPGAGNIYGSDRELVIVEPAQVGTVADVAAVTAVADRALRAALATFGPARDD